MINKILIISPEFNEEFILYQPWRQIYELAIKIQQKGIEVAIGTNSSDKDLVKGIKIINFKQKNLKILSEQSKIQILDFNPDVIIWMSNPLSGTLTNKNQINKIPNILYISTMPMTFDEIKYFSLKEIMQSGMINLLSGFFPFNKIYKKLNDNSINGIIVTSESIKHKLQKFNVSSKKIMVSPLCFESNFYSESIIKNSNNVFTICYLGPIFSIRGVNLLLDTVALLKKNRIPIKLNFLLRSKFENDKQKLVEMCQKRKISDLVIIKSGILPQEEIFSTILHSDSVVLPTKFVWNEPPLAILEAMMLGKTVVTSNVCGLPELVSDNGFTLPPTKDSFYECIASISSDLELVKNTGLKSKKFIESLPGWQKLADWTLEQLESIIKDSKKSIS